MEESKTYKREIELDNSGGVIVCIFNLSNISENNTESGCELTPEDFVSLRKTYVRFRYILPEEVFAGNRMRNTYLRIIASNKTVICSEAIFRQVQLPCSRHVYSVNKAIVLAEILPRNKWLFYCLQLFWNMYFLKNLGRALLVNCGRTETATNIPVIST